MAEPKPVPPTLPPRPISEPPPVYSVLPDDEICIADRPITLIDSTDVSRPPPPALPPRKESMLSTATSASVESLLSPASGMPAPRDRSTSPGSMTDGSNDVPRPRKGTIHLTPRSTYQRPSSSTSRYSEAPLASREGTDPRTSSMQSLLPVESTAGLRRTLLLVYVHGFVGNDMSFGSFPAHVHNLLGSYLAESHVVHTKIYPRYKSRNNISYARDDFSNWLSPHENPHTDVVLIGHSLGGILTAEVVLLPSNEPGSNSILQHRILGTISFDTPFLGMHPSVVGTGIASLFQPTTKTSDMLKSPQSQSKNNLSLPVTQASTDTTIPSESLSPSGSIRSDPFSVPSNDPNYNPAFPNDVVLPQRTGKLENFMYFWNKHCGDMMNAVSSYVTSHLEFGGCLADYPGLYKRYSAVRGLENIDPSTQPRDPQGRTIPRVRFTNYYSASTGRVKVKSRLSSRSFQQAEATEMGSLSRPTSQSPSRNRPSRTPSFRSAKSRRSTTSLRSVERPWQYELTTRAGDTLPEPSSSNHEYPPISLPVRERPVSSDGGAGEMVQLDPEQHIEDDENHATDGACASDPNDLPLITPLAKPPKRPEEKDYTLKEFFKASLTAYTKELKKYAAEKKSHDKAVKARNKMIKADKKATDKATSKEAKERAKVEKERIKAEQKAAKAENLQQVTNEKHKLKRRATLNQETYDKALQLDADEQGVPVGKVENKKRDRKFCALPSKDSSTGERDATWVRVYMEGVNEIEAHTSMFVMSETYAKLVGDTAERIQRWVKEAGLAGEEMQDVKR